MSTVDLNIIDRGLKGQKWTAEKGAITSGDLDLIQEGRTNNSNALNALPTPFARFFVVEEAFRRVLDEFINPNNRAGDSYRQLVSDTLDIFEILYNLKYHEEHQGKDSYRIIVKEWNMDSDLASLKASVPILGNAVANYILDDLGQSGKKLFFVILVHNGKEYLLGTSSPLTGFVTPPDLDKKTSPKDKSIRMYCGEIYSNMPRLERKAEGSLYKPTYFNSVCLFEDRSVDFKNYMFYIVDKYLTDAGGEKMPRLRNYIKKVASGDTDINRNWVPQTQPHYSDEGSELIINGLPIHVNSGIDTTNFFNDTIVKLPFRLSEEYFNIMTYDGKDCNARDFDFLLPIRREALSVIGDNDLKCKCHIKHPGNVTISLKYSGKEYIRDYDENNGQIIDLGKEHINLNIGIFPNILSPNDNENNYFKVMAVMNDSAPDRNPISIKGLNLSFFSLDNENSLTEIGIIDRNAVTSSYGVYPAVMRTEQDIDKGLNAGTKTYEIFNKRFDMIGLSLSMYNHVYEGLLIPKWRQAEHTNDSYTYAVDLGTTNTYVSCRKNGVSREPEQLTMEKPMVAFLHRYKSSPQHPLVSIIEKGISPECLKNFNTEFVPAIIDGLSYRFPVRTALCMNKNDRHSPVLFDNCNIAFFYEKAMWTNNQLMMTDLKWDGHEKELRQFIRELLLIIKADVLTKDGQLADSRIIWFRPLSFKNSTRDAFASIWKEEAKHILNIDPSQITCISESEAPYYYFNKKNTFNSIDAVTVVDIGGGSTDFVYFSDSKPVIANSVHFGCDTLWSNGFTEYENSRENGIFERFKDKIHMKDNDELEQLNLKMLGDKDIATKDIINFWLSNDCKCEMSKLLKETYKPLFLYHFASIVYFMAKMYKTRGLDCPRTVLFCGNGSRYIDELLSSDTSTIKELVKTIFEEIYGTIKDIQVILPASRKECTCYGGLYRNSDAEIPERFNFQGISDMVYENVGQLKSNLDKIRLDILETFDSFNRLYGRLLDILVARGEFGKRVEKEKFIDLVSSGIEDSFTTNFKRQVAQKLNDSEEYQDSVFFLPVIDNILKLTKDC